jgi:hypothetical protein
MSFLADLPRRLIGLAFRLLLLAAAAIFTLSLLFAAVVVLIFSVLRALLTGRKPAPAMVWGRFRDFRAQSAWPGQGPGRHAQGGQAPAEVVDVQAREVPEAPSRRIDPPGPN